MGNNPNFEIRDFRDGTFSVIARLWNPQKKFYEHPTLINLTEEEAKEHCFEIIKDNPSIEEIVYSWVYIGN